MTYVRPRKIKRGDLAPALRIVVKSNDPQFDPQVLVGARVVGAHDGQVIFDRPASEINPVTGGVEVVMQFEAADTDEAGNVLVEVELTWPGGRTQTIRSDNTLIITPDLA